jgi:hypothetical protein
LATCEREPVVYLGYATSVAWPAFARRYPPEAEAREAEKHQRPGRGFWDGDASERLTDVDAAVHGIGSEGELIEIKRDGSVGPNELLNFGE